MAPRARPTAEPPIATRPRSSARMAAWKPSFSGPRRADSGTRHSSRPLAGRRERKDEDEIGDITVRAEVLRAVEHVLVPGAPCGGPNARRVGTGVGLRERA